MAELIRLDRRPAPGCHMVSINALSPVTSYAKLRGCLEECGGLLDNLVLHRPDSTRQYAMAQFFCESDAERCRQQFDGRWIDGVRVDARRYNASGGRKRPRALGSHAEGAPLALSISKAIDVMNHFVGCFGWSHEILELQPASLSRPDGGASGGSHQTTARHTARVRVRLRSGVEALGEGSGVGSGPSVGPALQQSKKSAVSNAVLHALGSLAIVRFASGKVAVRALGGGGAPAALAPHPRRPAVAVGATCGASRVSRPCDPPRPQTGLHVTDAPLCVD